MGKRLTNTPLDLNSLPLSFEARALLQECVFHREPKSGSISRSGQTERMQGLSSRCLLLPLLIPPCFICGLRSFPLSVFSPRQDSFSYTLLESGWMVCIACRGLIRREPNGGGIHGGGRLIQFHVAATKSLATVDLQPLSATSKRASFLTLHLWTLRDVFQKLVLPLLPMRSCFA